MKELLKFLENILEIPRIVLILYIYIIIIFVSKYFLNDSLSIILLYTFATNSEWLVKSIVTVFEIAGDLVDEKTENLAFLIVSKDTDDPEKDSELRKYAVVESIKVLEKDSSNISSNLLIWTVKVFNFLL